MYVYTMLLQSSFVDVCYSLFQCNAICTSSNAQVIVNCVIIMNLHQRLTSRIYSALKGSANPVYICM